MLVSITCLFYKCIVQYVSYTACTSEHSKVLSYYFHKLERLSKHANEKVQYRAFEAAGMLQENNMPKSVL